MMDFLTNIIYKQARTNLAVLLSCELYFCGRKQLEIEKDLWRTFLSICKRIGTSGAVEIRRMIKEFIEQNEKKQ